MQWIALYYLGKEEFISQKELAERMNVKESSVARLLDRMERDELVGQESSRSVLTAKLSLKEKEKAL